MSDESKQKSSEAHIGLTPWNAGLTKETDERVLSTSLKLIGHPGLPPEKILLAKQKEYITKKERGTFNTSRPESALYEVLCNLYGQDGVVTQYKEDRYPFLCDFYIKSLDLFIELNYHWTHGSHPFNPEDEQDQEIVCKIQDKIREKGTYSQYNDYLNNWTVKDPLKLKTFRKNKLNFMIIYKDITITE